MGYKTVWLDMDGTLFDFNGAVKGDLVQNPVCMFEEGFFENLKPLPGALEAVQKLIKDGRFRVGVLTKPVATSPISYTEKVRSLAKWFPCLLDNIIMAQHKSDVKGDYLIDDNKWPGFEGITLMAEADPERSRKAWEANTHFILGY